MYCYAKSGILIIQNVPRNKLYKFSPDFKVISTKINKDGELILYIASNKDLIFYNYDHDFFYQ